jgi:signal transduction histidine kinase
VQGAPADVLRAQRSALERGFEWLFQRQRRYYTEIQLGLVMASVQFLIVPGYTALLQPIYDATSDQFWHFVAGFELATLLLGAPGMWAMVYRTFGREIRWMKGLEDPDPNEMWERFVVQLPRLVAAIVAWYFICCIPPALYVGAELDLSATAQAVYILGLAFLIGGVGVFQLLLFDVAFRPALREIAAASTTVLTPPPGVLSLRMKLLILLPAMSLFNGMAVGAASTNKLGRETRLGVTVGTAFAVSATVAFVLALMLRHSLLSRLDELREALAKVRAGSVGTRLVPLGGDEVDELGNAFNDMASRIEQHNDEMRASRARIVAASDAERRRVERDLHDGAQQHLVLLNLKLSRLEKAVASGTATQAEVQETRADLDRALTELRDLAHGIYPQVLGTDGLPAALRDAATRTAIPTTVHADGAGRYPAEIEAAVYFCCMEALQNAGKHAGSEATATVTLDGHDGELRFEVADTGPGFDPANVAGSTGLQNLADRIGALGGELRIESAPGTGARVSGRLPLST